ncbi:MAG TPA: cupin domain-containing protein [Solirubrobacteraceae bacterium]|nr:cupin domain-containing protein [Solirubrobacteraceae bacterium]
MSDFTIKNFLTDIEDMSARRGVQGLEARFGRDAMESEHLGVSLFRLAPNQRIPWGHRHREQEEAYVVVAGSGRARLDAETRELRQWDLIRVAPHVARGFEAGPEGLDLLAVGSDRPEGGDGEMVPDFWED